MSRIRGDVETHTSGGDIRVDSVAGSVKIQSSGGDLTLRGVDGKMFGETSGGSIEAWLIRENRGIRLETSGGDVYLYVPKATAATLDASTSGGSVKCDLPVMVSGKISEHNLRGKINGGGNPIELSTSGGDILISISD